MQSGEPLQTKPCLCPKAPPHKHTWGPEWWGPPSHSWGGCCPDSFPQTPYWRRSTSWTQPPQQTCNWGGVVELELSESWAMELMALYFDLIGMKRHLHTLELRFCEEEKNSTPAPPPLCPPTCATAIPSQRIRRRQWDGLYSHLKTLCTSKEKYLQ